MSPSNLFKIGLIAIALGMPFVLIQTQGSNSSHSVSPTSAVTNSQTASESSHQSTCPVSGLEMGSMGEPVVHSYEGQEIRLCCSGCISQFEQDPNKYMKAMDSALNQEQLSASASHVHVEHQTPKQ